MATATDPAPNSGIHQLDKDAYPPTESDDEDSFVVLDSYGPRTLQLEVEPISTSGIEKTLNSISETLSKQTLTSTDNMKGSIQKSTINPNSYVSISGEEIQKNVDNLIAENTKLKDTLAQNNATMKVQVEKITKWQEEVQQVQESHKKKFSEMKVIIQELRGENAKLKDELETIKNKPVNVEEVKTENTVLAKRSENILQFELEAAQKKIKEMEKALDIIITEKQNLSSDISEYKKEIANCQEEIKLLNAANEKVSSDKSFWIMTESELNSELQNVKSECEALKSANSNLTNCLEETNDKHKNLSEAFKEKECFLQTAQAAIVELQETLANAKQQLMASQMHITELKEQHAKESQERVSQEACLQKKQEQKNQILEDEITALHSQMDIFKRDFETERTLKETILVEKNAMVDELQMLQRRNAQLIEEVDQLRSGYVPVRREDVASSPPPNNSTHTCPRCFFRFSTLQALQNHVYRCIELDSLP